MVNRKSIRTRGKLQLSKYFQELDDGAKVAVTINKSVSFSFPKRLQGRTGVVVGKRGKSYVVEVKDVEKVKKFIIAPIHLKKLNASKKQEKSEDKE